MPHFAINVDRYLRSRGSCPFHCNKHTRLCHCNRRIVDNPSLYNEYIRRNLNSGRNVSAESPPEENNCLYNQTRSRFDIIRCQSSFHTKSCLLQSNARR